MHCTDVSPSSPGRPAAPGAGSRPRWEPGEGGGLDTRPAQHARGGTRTEDEGGRGRRHPHSGQQRTQARACPAQPEPRRGAAPPAYEEEYEWHGRRRDQRAREHPGREAGEAEGIGADRTHGRADTECRGHHQTAGQRPEQGGGGRGGGHTGVRLGHGEVLREAR
ncbi:hypothetical protein SSPO_088600 [Streptomyces antimycoticus]|uniref:Uncharacterized protein n=1 Tax=Streptomyces antimycoticus TaxID=68175 RepID=A0A499UY81_9ACTN|nr:hypothetical protein [Streptomyces antimycoticus]BBJ46142.1 hypothetical protein SSPO_088600 [Streptomyces antimycoticus]